MTRNIKLIQIDGHLPNVALMRLSAWHKAQGNNVYFSTKTEPSLFEPVPDETYGSSIFTYSLEAQAEFRRQYPDGVLGGTGISHDGGLTLCNKTLASVGVPDDFKELDYDIYPDFDASIGFTQTGCRLKCKFCVVPKKEGANQGYQTINQIWRGAQHPKHIHLLDNDFFGQEDWLWRCQEIINGGFKVSFTQGINVRLFTKKHAKILARMKYYDDSFKTRRIYTAWDMLGQEKLFFRKIKLLLKAGIKPRHIMVYMLIGYAPNETIDDIMYRIERIKETGMMPFPMVYREYGKEAEKTLAAIQRWVVMRFHEYVPWEKYRYNPDKYPAQMQDGNLFEYARLNYA